MNEVKVWGQTERSGVAILQVDWLVPILEKHEQLTERLGNALLLVLLHNENENKLLLFVLCKSK